MTPSSAIPRASAARATRPCRPACWRPRRGKTRLRPVQPLLDHAAAAGSDDVRLEPRCAFTLSLLRARLARRPQREGTARHVGTLGTHLAGRPHFSYHRETAETHNTGTIEEQPERPIEAETLDRRPPSDVPWFERRAGSPFSRLSSIGKCARTTPKAGGAVHAASINGTAPDRRSS